jgi:hypothetical protein
VQAQGHRRAHAGVGAGEHHVLQVHAANSWTAREREQSTAGRWRMYSSDSDTKKKAAATALWRKKQLASLTLLFTGSQPLP